MSADEPGQFTIIMAISPDCETGSHEYCDVFSADLGLTPGWCQCACHTAEFPGARDYAYCATCGVRGCVCEYCDDCDAMVNPYEHFAEWKPGGGAHLSDIAVRSLTTAREAEPGLAWRDDPEDDDPVRLVYEMAAGLNALGDAMAARRAGSDVRRIRPATWTK